MKKQIEEMAKYICNACEMGGGFDGECCLNNDYKKCGTSTETAEALYNADYRKASDVAREIFEEIENYMLDFEDITHTVNRTIGAATFALLKKKYTEGGNENT